MNALTTWLVRLTLVWLLWPLAPALAGAVVDAELAWSDRTDLGTPLSGRVAEVLVAPGDTVQPGQPLLRLDRRALLARREAARARLEAARQRLAEAVRERDRIEALFDRTLLSEHELQVARIDHAAAQATELGARAELAIVEQRLDEAELRAPFEARVLSVAARVGQTVVNRLQAAPLVVVARTGRMQALAALPAEQIAALATGQPVRVTVGGQDFDGRILDAGLEPAGSGGLYVLRVEFGVAPDQGLRAGMAARIALP